MLNWKLAGQIYGVFSRFAFMKDSGKYNIDDIEIEAFVKASRDLEMNNIVDVEELQILLDCIEECTGSHYWIDFEEPLYFDDEDEYSDDEDEYFDDEDYDYEDDYCDCGECSDDESSCEDNESEIDEAALKDILNNIAKIKSIVIKFKDEE